MAIKEKQKTYILFGVFGIIALIVYYNLLLEPLWSSFSARNKEFGILNSRVKAANKIIANEPATNKQYAVLKERSDYVEKKLPGQDKISNLLQDFSGIAESSGVTILKIKPLEQPAGTGQAKNTNAIYSEFPILIEAKAGYHQFGDFINKLENMDRFIKINDIDIKNNDRDLRHHDIKIKIMTYVLQ